MWFVCKQKASNLCFIILGSTTTIIRSVIIIINSSSIVETVIDVAMFMLAVAVIAVEDILYVMIYVNAHCSTFFIIIISNFTIIIFVMIGWWWVEGWGG